MSAGAIYTTAMQEGLHSCEVCDLISRPAPGKDEGELLPKVVDLMRA